MTGMKKIFCCGTVCFICVISCKDSNPSGPAGMDALTGSWYPIMETEEWKYEGEEGSTSYEYSGTEELFVITESEWRFYYYSETDEDDCYETYSMPFTVSGNSLIGEEFSGSETDDDGEYSWNTTFERKGDELTVQMTFTYSSGDWEKMTIVLKEYSGEFPPDDWPQQECSLMEKHRVMHPFHR